MPLDRDMASPLLSLSFRQVRRWYGRQVIGSVIVAAALAGCGSSQQSSLAQHLKQAAAQIGATPAPRALHRKLERTLAALTGDRPNTGAERSAKRLAIAGVRSWLRGLESQIAFVENDSGNLPIAARDAHRAYHARLVGANLLRRAGERLDIQIGMLSGF
jgi:hypothetical protein